MNKEIKNNIADSILSKIEEGKKKPYSKMYFKSINILPWLLAFLTAIVGSLLVSSIIFRIVNLRHPLPPFLGIGGHERFLAGDFPIILFIIFMALVFILYKEIRMTRSGYKYEMPIVFLSIGLVSFILGIFWYALGFGYHVDRVAVRNIPMYRDIERVQIRRWFTPESGALIGKVVDIDADEILIKDPEGNTWNVLLAKGNNEEVFEISVGQKVGLVGQMDLDDFIFRACDVHSLELDHAGIRNNSERKNVEVRINRCGDRTAPQNIKS